MCGCNSFGPGCETGRVLVRNILIKGMLYREATNDPKYTSGEVAHKFGWLCVALENYYKHITEASNETQHSN